MPSVFLTVDLGTHKRISKLRRISRSMIKIVERAIMVTPPDFVAPPATRHKTYTLSVNDEAHAKLKATANSLGWSISKTVSALVQTYLWTLDSELEARDLSIKPGSIGVTFSLEHSNLVANYIDVHEITFGRLVEVATKAVYSKEVELAALNTPYRTSSNGTHGTKFFVRINSQIAAKLDKLPVGAAMTKSSIVRAVVASYLDPVNARFW